MIEIKALSFFQGNPQICDQKPDSYNSFTKQTQQFPCTSNAWLKGPETKKAKQGTIKQTQQTIMYQPWKNN